MQRIHTGRYPAHSHLTVRTEAPFFRTRLYLKERYGTLCLLRLLSHILYRITSFSYGVLTKNTVNLLYEEHLFLKNKKMSIRISEENLAAIHRKAEQADMTFTDYVTKACLGKQIVVIDGLDDVLRQQKAIGSNLNQLTMLCNMGRVSVASLAEMKEQYAEVSAALTELLERKRWSDGNG